MKQQLLARGMRSEKQGLQEQLDESEKLMQEASLTWEQKEEQTEQIHQVCLLKVSMLSSFKCNWIQFICSNLIKNY